MAADSPVPEQRLNGTLGTGFILFRRNSRELAVASSRQSPLPGHIKRGGWIYVKYPN